MDRNIINYIPHPFYPGYSCWKYAGTEMDHCIFATNVWFIPADYATMNQDFNF